MNALKNQSFVFAVIFVLSLVITPMAAEELPADVNSWPTVVDDLNGDGILDLVTFNDDGSISASLGNGDGTFAEETTYSEEDLLLLLIGGEPNSTMALDVESANTYDGTLSAQQSGGEGATAIAGQIIYVDADATGDANGVNWADAFNYLQDALAVANYGDEIRVAEGTYRPDQGAGITPGDRQATLQLKNGVALYGGYAGFREPHPDVRHIEKYETILSGDLNGDDGSGELGTALSADNCSDAEPIFYGFYYKGSTKGATADGSASCDVGGYPDVWYKYTPDVNRTVVIASYSYSYLSIHTGCPGSAANELACGLGSIMASLVAGQTYYIRVYSYPGFFSIRITSNAENSYHVVTASGTDPNTILDGFAITAGNANGSFPDPTYSGGGMYNDNGSPTIANCTFRCNFAFGRGGGMYNNSSSNLTLINCTFSMNSAHNGGGMYNLESNLMLTNCIFDDNWSSWGGGGMQCIRGSLTMTNSMTNCTFSNNWAWRYGGGMVNVLNNFTLTNCSFIGNSTSDGLGGGMLNSACSSRLTNCSFIGNFAGIYGGGMLDGGPGTSILTNCIFTRNSTKGYGGGVIRYIGGDSMALTNCTFSNNTASSGRGIRVHHGGDVTLTNCILWDGGNEISNYHGGTITVAYSDIQGSWSGPGGNNIDADPMFVRNPDPGPDGNWDGVDDHFGNLHLLPFSPCIDAGDNNSLPADIVDLDDDGNTTEPIPFDIDGNPRIINGTVNMGAFEGPQGPKGLIAEMALDVVDLNLQQGIENSLDAKLDTALQALEDINENNNGAAINTLQAFINAVEAQRGNKIPEAEANALIAKAMEIIDLLSDG